MWQISYFWRILILILTLSSSIWEGIQLYDSLTTQSRDAVDGKADSYAFIHLLFF